MFCFLETSFLMQEQALEQVQQNLSNCSSTSQLNLITSTTEFPSVSQLADVQPTDWAFQALKSLIERLEGISGHSQEIFRGNQSITRSEFALGLYGVLEHLDQSKTENLSPIDGETLQRLKADFATELAILNNRGRRSLASLGFSSRGTSGRIEKLDTQIQQLEERQFSPTTKLSGEVIVGVSDDFGDNTDGTLTLQHRAKLNLTSSFTGKDKLKIGLSNGNFEEFSFVRKITNEGRLGFSTNTNNDFELSNLSYLFPIGKQISIFVASSGDDVNTINPIFSKTGTGAISRFGRKNSVYRLIESGGFGLTYKFNDEIELGLGYYVGEPEKSSVGDGLFNGDYSAAVQLEIEPNDRFTLGLLYLHSYNDSNLSTGTGSLRSQIDLNRPVIANSYSLEASWEINSNFILGGWVGFTDATVLNLGKAEVLNYAMTLAFEDFVREGDLLGFIIGQEPRLIGTSGFTIDGRRNDPDISLHLEALYRYQLNDKISITPGLIWISAPNHNNNNRDILVLTIRSTFSF